MATILIVFVGTKYIKSGNKEVEGTDQEEATDLEAKRGVKQSKRGQDF